MGAHIEPSLWTHGSNAFVWLDFTCNADSRTRVLRMSHRAVEQLPPLLPQRLWPHVHWPCLTVSHTEYKRFNFIPAQCVWQSFTWPRLMLIKLCAIFDAWIGPFYFCASLPSCQGDYFPSIFAHPNPTPPSPDMRRDSWSLELERRQKTKQKSGSTLSLRMRYTIVVWSLFINT